MKTSSSVLSVLLSASLILSGCVTQPPSRDFKQGEHVQAIEVMDKQHIFAQDDILLKNDSLDKQLADLKPAWDGQFKSIHRKETVAATFFLTALAGLAVCFAQTNPVNTLGWCGGTFGAALISSGFQKSANEKRFEIVNEYNHGLK